MGQDRDCTVGRLRQAKVADLQPCQPWRLSLPIAWDGCEFKVHGGYLLRYILWVCSMGAGRGGIGAKPDETPPSLIEMIREGSQLAAKKEGLAFCPQVCTSRTCLLVKHLDPISDFSAEFIQSFGSPTNC